MSSQIDRRPHFELGLHLGELQQGLRRPFADRGALMADIQAIRRNAVSGGYEDDPYAAKCANEIGAGDLDGALLSATALVGHIQGQVQGQEPQAPTLNTGIRLGWLQQGSLRDSRSFDEAVDDLASLLDVASRAGFRNFEDEVQTAQGRLQRPPRLLSSIRSEIPKIINVLRSQL